MRGVDNPDREMLGMTHPNFFKYPVNRETMMHWVVSWLKRHRFVFAGCEAEVAAKVIDLTAQALHLQPGKSTPTQKPAQRRRKKKIDLLAVPVATMPEDEPEAEEPLRKRVISLRQPAHEPATAQQLALF